MDNLVHDVVIIGAGISGLYAGSLLKEKGLDVLVLEARDRIAGRQWTRRDGTKFSDMGGAYIGPQQTKILEVLEKLGLQTYDLNLMGKNILNVKGCKVIYSGEQPFFWNPLVSLDMNNLIRTIDNWSQQVPPDCPWEAERAQEWDSMTVKDLVDQCAWTSMGRKIGRLGTMLPLVTEPDQISALYFLQFVRLCGGFDAILATNDGLQQMKVIGGSSQLSDRLAQALPGQVLLKKVVSEIKEQSSGIVRIHCADGDIYQAKHVIMTVPLPCLHLIQFDPPLPSYLQQLAAIKPPAHVVKTVMFYKERFWRDKGFSGQFLGDGSVIAWAVDDTKPDGSYPAIMGFIVGKEVPHYLKFTKEERKHLICKQYAEIFGLPEFLEPLDYWEKYWQDDDEETMSRNTCVHTLPPKVLTTVRSNPSMPHGCVHFAGTEMAMTSRGYMDGALRSAEKTAKEVLVALGHKVSPELANDFLVEVPYLQQSIKYIPSTPQLLLFLMVIGSVLLAVLAEKWF